MENTAKALYDEMNNKCKPNTYKPELGEFTELRRLGNDRVEFSIGWFKQFIVSFRPQTIGVKYNCVNKEGKTTQVSKSLPLEQENLLDTIISLI